jgi:hypothetical protein
LWPRTAVLLPLVEQRRQLLAAHAEPLRIDVAVAAVGIVFVPGAVLDPDGKPRRYSSSTCRVRAFDQPFGQWFLEELLSYFQSSVCRDCGGRVARTLSAPSTTA